MKKLVLVVLLVVFALPFCGCSDGSHYRGESAEEKRVEARIEEETYKYELYKEIYEEAHNEVVYNFEGMLQSHTGAYIEVDQLIEIIRRQFDDEMVDAIVFHPDIDIVSLYDIYEEEFGSN